MHLKPDVVAACQEIRAGRLTLRGYLKTLRQPIISASFAADDPTPALVELPVAAWNHFVGRIGIWRRRIAQKSVGRFLAGRIAK
jgi:predicted ATP-grasp superfamily ATP-dependent carboligase